MDAGSRELRAEWSAAYINDLPDSAFAYIEPGGEKDEAGKTIPRALRHFPHHDAAGALDRAHLQNAMARAHQSPFGEKAMPHLEMHAKAMGMGDHSLRERRNVPAEVRLLESEGGRQIAWYPALFDSYSEDLGGFRERVNRRAFNKTVREADVRALVNHDPNYVLGRNTAGTLDLSVTDKGLRAVVNPPQTQWATDLMTSITRGDISGGSFGFEVVTDQWGMDEGGALVRELREVKLFDVSVVTYPAYSGTNGAVALRSLLQRYIEPESLTRVLALRQAGLPLDDQDSAEVQRLISKLLPPEPRKHSAERVREMDLALARARLAPRRG